MKKISTLALVIILILSASIQVFAIYETDDNNYRNGSYDCVGHINEHDITHITHHTCGYGGTSCRPCEYSSTFEDYCGCVLIQYKCCCGNKIANGGYTCSSHGGD